MDEILEITVDDLYNIKQLIEVSAKNGLLHPEGLTSIGKLYDKIAGILNTESIDND
jgi:hypothetical protein